MENIIMAVFPIESEAYQAFSELKRDIFGSSYFVSQAVLVKKENNTFLVRDKFDTGAETSDDTFGGTLIGSFIGILGGPIGVLLGAGFGGLVGAAVDNGDIEKNGTVIEKVASNIKNDTTAILAFVQEEDVIAVDSKFSKYNASVTRYDAAEIEAEIEEAEKAQREIEKQARIELRKNKSDERKAKLTEKRSRIASEFEQLKKKLKK